MLLLQHQPSWQLNADGTRMTGRMVLKKTVREGVKPTSSAAILGLKVIGGQPLEGSRRSAIIEKVKKGSIADIEGQLRPGISLLFSYFFFIKVYCFSKNYSGVVHDM